MSFRKTLCVISISFLVLCGFVTTKDEKYVSYFLHLWTANLFRERNFTLYDAKAIFGRDHVHRIEMSLSCYKALPLIEARKMLVSVVQDFLDKINTDPGLKEKGLIKENFLARQLYLRIKCDNVFGETFDTIYIREIILDRDHVTYITFKNMPEIWGKSYTIHEDFDYSLMLTGNARPAEESIAESTIIPQMRALPGDVSDHPVREHEELLPQKPKPVEAPKLPVLPPVTRQSLMLEEMNQLALPPSELPQVEGLPPEAVKNIQILTPATTLPPPPPPPPPAAVTPAGTQPAQTTVQGAQGQATPAPEAAAQAPAAPKAVSSKALQEQMMENDSLGNFLLEEGEESVPAADSKPASVTSPVTNAAATPAANSVTTPVVPPATTPASSSMVAPATAETAVPVPASAPSQTLSPAPSASLAPSLHPTLVLSSSGSSNQTPVDEKAKDENSKSDGDAIEKSVQANAQPSGTKDSGESDYEKAHVPTLPDSQLADNQSEQNPSEQNPNEQDQQVDLVGFLDDLLSFNQDEEATNTLSPEQNDQVSAVASETAKAEPAQAVEFVRQPTSKEALFGQESLTSQFLADPTGEFADVEVNYLDVDTADDQSSAPQDDDFEMSEEGNQPPQVEKTPPPPAPDYDPYPESDQDIEMPEDEFESGSLAEIDDESDDDELYDTPDDDDIPELADLDSDSDSELLPPDASEPWGKDELALLDSLINEEQEIADEVALEQALNSDELQAADEEASDELSLDVMVEDAFAADQEEQNMAEQDVAEQEQAEQVQIQPVEPQQQAASPEESKPEASKQEEPKTEAPKPSLLTQEETAYLDSAFDEEAALNDEDVDALFGYNGLMPVDEKELTILSPGQELVLDDTADQMPLTEDDLQTEDASALVQEVAEPPVEEMALLTPEEALALDAPSDEMDNFDDEEMEDLLGQNQRTEQAAPAASEIPVQQNLSILTPEEEFVLASLTNEEPSFDDEDANLLVSEPKNEQQTKAKPAAPPELAIADSPSLEQESAPDFDDSDFSTLDLEPEYSDEEVFGETAAVTTSLDNPANANTIGQSTAATSQQTDRPVRLFFMPSRDEEQEPADEQQKQKEQERVERIQEVNDAAETEQPFDETQADENELSQENNLQEQLIEEELALQDEMDRQELMQVAQMQATQPQNEPADADQKKSCPAAPSAPDKDAQVADSSMEDDLALNDLPENEMQADEMQTESLFFVPSSDDEALEETEDETVETEQAAPRLFFIPKNASNDDQSDPSQNQSEDDPKEQDQVEVVIIHQDIDTDDEMERLAQAADQKPEEPVLDSLFSQPVSWVQSRAQTDETTEPEASFDEVVASDENQEPNQADLPQDEETKPGFFSSLKQKIRSLFTKDEEVSDDTNQIDASLTEAEQDNQSDDTNDSQNDDTQSEPVTSSSDEDEMIFFFEPQNFEQDALTDAEIEEIVVEK